MLKPSFKNDILPLFRPMDIQCMRGLEPPRGPVFLAKYEYMSKKENGDFVNASAVLAALKKREEGEEGPPRMPYGGPYWSDANIELFAAWIAAGCPK